MLARSRAVFARLQGRGLFRDDVDIDDALRAWTVLIAGVISQQLANAPQESFEDGRFTSGLPDLVAMYLAHYGPPPQQAAPTRRSRHADTRRPDR
jgi:hypothetical protein